MNESPLAPVIAGAAGPELGNRLMYEYVARHGPRIELPDTAAEWESRAAGLRARYLELYLHGHPPDLLQEPPRVVWGDTLDPSPEYRIRKLRFEGYPGVWVPALLYEPATPAGGERSTPAVLDVNGHESRGIAVEHKQARCSNLARRGIPALSLELLGHGEMTNLAPHNAQQFLDLLGQRRRRGVLPHHEARPGPPHRSRADRPGARGHDRAVRRRLADDRAVGTGRARRGERAGRRAHAGGRPARSWRRGRRRAVAGRPVHDRRLRRAVRAGGAAPDPVHLQPLRRLLFPSAQGGRPAPTRRRAAPTSCWGRGRPLRAARRHRRPPQLR